MPVPALAHRVTRAGRALLATAAAAALTVGLLPAPAQAQGLPGSISPEQIANGALGTISPESLSQLLYFGNLPGSSGSSMTSGAYRPRSSWTPTWGWKKYVPGSGAVNS